jgi:hypothetical protein
MYSKGFKIRRTLHTDAKEKEVRDPRGAVIFRPQQASVLMPCEDYLNPNSERFVRF